jgi:ankyrin repeat protein
LLIKGQTKIALALLKAGYKPINLSEKESTALQIAIQYKLYFTSQGILKIHPECINTITKENSKMPLHIAALSGDEATFRLLLAEKAWLTSETNKTMKTVQLKLIKKELKESGRIDTLKVLTEKGYFKDSIKKKPDNDINQFNNRQELGASKLFFKNNYNNVNNTVKPELNAQNKRL